MFRLLSIIILILLHCNYAQAETVSDLRIGNHGNYARVVMEMMGDPNFAAYVKDNPKRLEIYYASRIWSTPKEKRVPPPFTAIQHDEVIGMDGIAKISLTLDAPYKIRNAFVLAADDEGPSNRLVVDIEPVPYAVFQKQAGLKHGTLLIAGEKTQSIETLLHSIAGEENFTIPSDKVLQDKPARKPIVVIDAGHGGQDPGAISPGGIREKNITLSMAKTIARILNNSGRYDARLTRTTDHYIKLYDRVKIARNADADIFVSVHADSVGNKNTRGASVYTLSNTASDKQTAKLAARENRADIIAGVDLGVEDPDVSFILLDLSMRETMNRSKTLANTVVGTFQNTGVGTLNRPHRYAGFAVLKAPDVPSILIETGFVSNESEARRLLSPEYQEKVGKALLQSLDSFFDQK